MRSASREDIGFRLGSYRRTLEKAPPLKLAPPLQTSYSALAKKFQGRALRPVRGGAESMSLSPGSRFGSYEVIAPLGVGGMGEVFRARDTNLKREVAIKVLPRDVADDADRIARFQREAEILASLNHPNIAQVYGLEKVGAETAIVMELVEGPTLADRIKAGPIPPDEAMAIALQIIAALEAAHERLIVHRDLKPANVKVRVDGTVKVLDFGISKPIDPAAISGGTPVATTPAMTQTGIILGTAAYMSPEQARGRFVDQRTDIWAFGCVLFEMLTGQPAFGGEDVMLTLARVLDRDTDLSSIPRTISPAVRHTLKLCLEKDARKRIADVRDVRLALEGRFETVAPRAAVEANARAVWKSVLTAAAALVVGVLIAGAIAMARWPAPESVTVTRFIQPLAPDQQFRSVGRDVLALSRDGHVLAYNAGDGIYVRHLDEIAPRLVVADDTGGTTNLVFSPDGQWLGYWAITEQELRKVRVTGGSPERLATTANPRGVWWTDDGGILLCLDAGVVRVPQNGGEMETIIPLTGLQCWDPEQLPDGSILYTAVSAGVTDDTIVIETPGTDDRAVLITGSDRAVYLPTGHIVTTSISAPGTLTARSFDLETRALGDAVPVEEDVWVAQSGGGKHQFAISRAGTLAVVRDDIVVDQKVRLGIADRAGAVELLDLPADDYRGVRVSPDGTMLAVQIIGANDRSTIWIHDLAGQRAFRPLLGAGSNERPLWTADSKQLLFASNRDGSWGIYRQNADGSGVAQRLTTAEEGVQHWPDALSTDMRTLVFTRLEGELVNIRDQSIWTVALDEAGRAALPVQLDTGGQAGSASLAPNGRWIAYRSNNTTFGADGQIQVQPLPATGEVHELTDRGGSYPLWSDNELVYRRVAAGGVRNLVLGRLEVESDESLAWGNESEVTVPNGIAFFGYRDFDLMPDGESLVVTVENVGTDGSIVEDPTIEIVTGWFEVLTERVPVP